MPGYTVGPTIPADERPWPSMWSLSFGPHGSVGATRLLEGRIVDDGTSLDITFMSSLLRSLAESGE